MHAGVLQDMQETVSVVRGHVEIYTIPDSKLSDKMARPIVPLKIAAGEASILKSQHLIILMLA